MNVEVWELRGERVELERLKLLTEFAAATKRARDGSFRAELGYTIARGWLYGALLEHVERVPPQGATFPQRVPETPARLQPMGGAR